MPGYAVSQYALPEHSQELYLDHEWRGAPTRMQSDAGFRRPKRVCLLTTRHKRSNRGGRP